MVYAPKVSEPARPAHRHISLILARDLASHLASAILLVDPEGNLVYFNEAAERILGRPYAEAQMDRAQLAKTFKPVDEAGEPVPIRDLPLAQAFRSGFPSHGYLRIEAVDGETRDIEVIGLPLFATADQLVGGLAVFWERIEEV